MMLQWLTVMANNVTRLADNNKVTGRLADNNKVPGRLADNDVTMKLEGWLTIMLQRNWKVG